MPIFGGSGNKDNDQQPSPPSRWRVSQRLGGEGRCRCRYLSLHDVLDPYHFLHILILEAMTSLSQRKNDFNSVIHRMEENLQKNMNLAGADLHGADLRGADFSEVNLFRADLREALLAGASFRQANLCEAKLAGADLREADLRGALLIRADLEKANLAGADLSTARLLQVKLRCADLRGANLTRADLSIANLSEANLSGACMVGADLRLANLRRALLTKADLCMACLVSADFSGASLVDANFYGTTGAYARLSVAQLAEVREITEWTPYLEFDRLLTAAVVSKQFYQTLLTMPAEAIGRGYDGQKFHFSATECQLLLSIKARTLEEFAQKLITLLRVA